MKETTAPDASTNLANNRPLHRRAVQPCHSHVGPNVSTRFKASTAPKASPSRSFRVALVPLIFELYDTLAPELRAKFQRFFTQVSNEFQIENVEFVSCEMVSNLTHLNRVCRDLSSQAVDTIVLAHLSYVPSGEILTALTSIDTPTVLWPAQTMERIIPKKLDVMDVMLNHGVHGTMDIANMLRRAKRPYGVVHGHWREPEFRRDLLEWGQVGALLQSLRRTNPLVLGERFPGMLDLRLEEEPFMKRLGIQPQQVPLTEFVEVRRQVNESAVLEIYEGYLEQFKIAPSLDESLLLRSAKNELVLRHLLEKHESRAIAVNFLDVCAEPEIADSLHLPVSNLMAEGIGYGAEADWETASLVSAMQAVLGVSQVGFAEIFSVDYAGNRVLLRHWGEGNVSQAAGKPWVIRSELNQTSAHTTFPTCSFQFKSGKYSLLNLSVTPDGQGQLITIPGEVDATPLPNCDGVQSLFRADCTNVRELLNRYAILGGRTTSC